MMLLMALKYQLDRQLLHKYIKYEHQPSGRSLLLTISTSVGKYVYAGEIRMKTHSTDQGKMRNQPEHENQAEMDQNKPKYQSKQA